MDAAVVYISNAKHAEQVRRDRDEMECAVASQPIAVGEESNHKYLVGRLIKAIKSSESRKRFEANDFTWKATRCHGCLRAAARPFLTSRSLPRPDHPRRRLRRPH